MNSLHTLQVMRLCKFSSAQVQRAENKPLIAPSSNIAKGLQQINTQRRILESEARVRKGYFSLKQNISSFFLTSQVAFSIFSQISPLFTHAKQLSLPTCSCAMYRTEGEERLKSSAQKHNQAGVRVQKQWLDLKPMTS